MNGFFDMRKSPGVQLPADEPFNFHDHFVYTEINVPGDKFQCDDCGEVRTGKAMQGKNMNGSRTKTLCEFCHSKLGKRPNQVQQKLKPKKTTLD